MNSNVMGINVDIAIFLIFILANLAFGLMSSKGVKTIKAYAVGDGNFSTLTIVSTIVATWISGQFFFAILTETYKEGIRFIATTLIGDFLGLLCISLLFIPRMKEFLGKISIAEAMGELYGNQVRLITSFAGFVAITGIIAIQLKVAGLLFQYALGIPVMYGIMISGFIITLYSALGGIRAVSFTDIMQFAAFSIIIPIVTYFLFHEVSNQDIVNTINHNPLFESDFNLSNSKTFYYISLFLWQFIPSFNPAIFQRIAIAQDINQAKRSFLISAIIVLLIVSIICFIGVLVISIYPNTQNVDVVELFILDYTWMVGFKGLILAAIMAMVMSTVDSYVNSSSVLLVHDLRSSLNINIKDELKSTRICAMVIGVGAIILAMREGSFLGLLLWASMFYTPVVTVPFMLSVFGFRSTKKTVLAGMLSGFVVVITWELFLKESMGNVVSVIPGMIANLIGLLSFHYLFKQEGGWVGIKNPEPVIEMRKNRKEKFQNLWNDLKSFNLMTVCRNNTPKSEGAITLLGLFVMVSTFINVISISRQIIPDHKMLINILYPVTLVVSMPLLAYPLWRHKWNNKQLVDNIAVISWNSSMFFVLIYFSGLLVLISNFSEIQMIAFMINIIVVSSLYKWRWALFTIISGTLLTTYSYKCYVNIEQIDSSYVSMEYKISYLLLLISGVVMMFLKPKQEYLEETENTVVNLKNEMIHLDHELVGVSGKLHFFNQKISDQKQEIERLGATAQRILNNVNHELRLPIGNVVNFSDMLHETLQKSDNTLLKDLSEEVVKNSTRISSMILNMLDLVMLEADKVNLNKRTINFSELVENRVRYCRKAYLEDKKIDFELSMQPEIMISVDPDYIRQMVDNIVTNAISYSIDGVIKVTTSTKDKEVLLTVEDQGIGIPEKEIYDVFQPFKMGSKTESKAEGRGIGLALCKSVAEAHGGKIIAESNGIKGAKFTVKLPIIG